VAGSALGFLGQQQTNSANAAEAQRNRDWQEQMYWLQHQHQTPSAQVAGLRAAGLNPLLMFSQGGGLGGGAGRVPGGGQAEFGNPFSDVANNVHSARELQEIHKERVKLEKAFNEANINKTNEETRTLGSQEALNREQIEAIREQTEMARKRFGLDENLSQAQIAAHLAQAFQSNSQGMFNNYAAFNEYMKRYGVLGIGRGLNRNNVGPQPKQSPTFRFTTTNPNTSKRGLFIKRSSP
jgi:DNA-binding transcriptional regulator YiaG